MDISEALEWLYSLENLGIKLGLQRMRELMLALGDPQLKFRTVHIAGTNGKGSVSAMLDRIYREAGLRTGLYTSPHLEDFRERIQVDGVMISSEEVVSLVDEIRSIMRSDALPKGRDLTFFEITTAIAFLHFQRKGVEMGVIEVGMGGRLDATNIIEPDCTVITRIGIEHTQYLGDTLAKIAYEKAGIIKEGVTGHNGRGGRVRPPDHRCDGQGQGQPLVGGRAGLRGTASSERDWTGPRSIFIRSTGTYICR